MFNIGWVSFSLLTGACLSLALSISCAIALIVVASTIDATLIIAFVVVSPVTHFAFGVAITMFAICW